MAVIKKSKKFSKVSKKKTMKRKNMKRKTMIGRGRGGGETAAQKASRRAAAAVLRQAHVRASGFGIHGQSSVVDPSKLSPLDPNKLGQGFDPSKVAQPVTFKPKVFNGTKVNSSSFKGKPNKY